MPERSNRNQTVRFGPYEADRTAGELRKNGIRLKLQEQPFRVLYALLERPGEVVTREALRQRLWADDTFVDFDDALNTAVNKIREALDGSARHPRFVETIPRRGYRWIGPAPRPVRRPFAHYAAAAGLVIALVSAGAWIRFNTASGERPAGQPFEPVVVTTYEGSETSPTLSPDGTQVAFSWDGKSGGNFDIYVHVIGSPNPLQITSDPADDLAPAWSPDGRHIAFLRPVGDPGHSRAAIYLMSPLGGPERKLVEGNFLALNRYFPLSIAWSPDAKTLFLTESDGVSQGICAVDVESREIRRLTSPPEYGDYAPAVSHDGKTLAFARRTDHWALYSTPVQGGDPRLLTLVRGFVSGVAWLPEGNEIVFGTFGAGFGPRLWRVPSGGGTPERVAILGAGGSQPVVSASGRRLVYVRRGHDRNVWRYDRPLREGGSSRARKIIGSTDIDGAPQISPDGKRIVFASTRSRSSELYVAASDGSEQVQITFAEQYSGSPRWSPDNQTILFDILAGGSSGIYTINSHDGAPVPVIVGQGNHTRPSSSHDGKWIYFSSDRTGNREIWKIPTHGNRIPQQLTRHGGDHAFESPDGNFVYYGGLDRTSVWRVPVEGGDEVAVITGVESIEGDRWDITQEGIYSIAEEHKPNAESRWVIKLFHLETKKETVVADLGGPTEGPTPLDVSPDGSWLIWTRNDRDDSDLMLVENFR